IVTTPLTHYSLTTLLTTVGHTTCIANACNAPSLATAFALTIA
ncbi:MAG: hypothetical protein QOK36_3555, partial [Gaiellales bacterium]|nr:hypothetical protein [Gaiellales bacterium]MDX6621169.1 hypothetical protein [Gaiellales bacterium]